ncbi:Ribonuclease H-like domain containing protein [Abeliophyllum distichum]|uniref:Ribonuclease H-like domain containing protein n=1 Tax=Abeliophyllum distichum TaxID=126358 RepID=A0ABD1U0J0_9LAMI
MTLNSTVAPPIILSSMVIDSQRIGPVAYKLALSPCNSNIHLVFPVSQLFKAKGVCQGVTHIPSQLNGEMEMMVEPEAVLGVRPGSRNNTHGIDVLIQWKWLPPLEATWEPFNLLKQQFPDFHLEDKVSLVGGSDDKPPIQMTCVRHRHKIGAEKGRDLE